MYGESGDGGGLNRLIEGVVDDGFSQTHIPNCSRDRSFSMPDKLLPQVSDSGVNCGEIVHDLNCTGFNGENHEYQIYTTGETPSYSDLLSMYPLPRSLSLLPCSSNSFSLGLMLDPHAYADPFMPLNMPPQPQSSCLLTDLYNSEREGRERGALMNQNGADGVSGERECNGKNAVKHSASEKQKRHEINNKFQALKDLIPNPTKDDRASIVGDTIEYINELKRRVIELKVVVERKRRAKQRVLKNEEKQQVLDDDSESSWVQRKSKNTEIDVRIMENDVTMKLVIQKRRISNCLLFVAKALDELHLELHHVSGGAIGDFYTYLINSKICEGSNVYASAVANKVIQAVDQYYTNCS